MKVNKPIFLTLCLLGIAMIFTGGYLKLMAEKDDIKQEKAKEDEKIIVLRKQNLMQTIQLYEHALENQIIDKHYTFQDKNTIYAIPISCIPLATGGNNPFGKWELNDESYWAYGLVQYHPTTHNYTYGFTYKDSAGYMLPPLSLTKIKNDGSQITKELSLQPLKSGLAIDYSSTWAGFEINETTKLQVLDVTNLKEDKINTCLLVKHDYIDYSNPNNIPILDKKRTEIVATIQKYIDQIDYEIGNLDYNFNQPKTIYAVPIECISVEKMSTDYFRNWISDSEDTWAYVLVEYDGVSNYKYGFTFKDNAGYGLLPVSLEELDETGIQINKGLSLKKPISGLASSYTTNWNNFKTNVKNKMIVLAAVQSDADRINTCQIAK